MYKMAANKIQSKQHWSPDGIQRCEQLKSNKENAALQISERRMQNHAYKCGGYVCIVCI